MGSDAGACRADVSLVLQEELGKEFESLPAVAHLLSKSALGMMTSVVEFDFVD
jgi:hypothetical protein